MNYEELLAENIRLSEINTKLAHELEQLRKLIYGSRKERFVPVQVDALKAIFLLRSLCKLLLR